MAKRASGSAKKAARKIAYAKPPAAKKTESFSVRVRPELREKLEHGAAANGRSLSNEIAYRLEGSFTEESAWGGAREKEIAQELAIRFLMGGQHAGEERFGVGVTAEQWMTDFYCYDRALEDAVVFLWSRRPDQSREGTEEWFALLVESLKGRIASRWIQNRERAVRK